MSDWIPDAPDTRSLGSVTREWLNLFIGDAGRIYFGLGQDVDLYRSALNQLKTNDSFDALDLDIGGISVITADRVLQNVTYQLDNYPDADHSGSGLTTVDTVGENVVAGEVLFMQNDGKYWKADADVVGTMPVKVLAMEDILADAAGELLHEGYYRDESWTWVLGAGEANLLYAHTTPGDLVQFAAKPSGSGDQVQVCGWVVTAKVIYFRPSLEMVEIA